MDLDLAPGACVADFQPVGVVELSLGFFGEGAQPGAELGQQGDQRRIPVRCTGGGPLLALVQFRVECAAFPVEPVVAVADAAPERLRACRSLTRGFPLGGSLVWRERVGKSAGCAGS
ncbi:hypothetical protein AB0I22_18635, partial [Streptomyces sp. NPDC050610]|uniref:hypothetical protein n=1 Tax=Streptomyces sp. NPDC050610 TaxID=3157097 RepID=UPI0034427696